jgi:hypothetical protein
MDFLRIRNQGLIRMIDKVKAITNRISMNVLGTEFKVRVERDNLNPTNGRIFLQIVFDAPCTKTNEVQEWHGRKWYLSEHMTDDEIVKTAYSAFKACIEHEVMESFKVDGIILFNPHLNFEQLLAISHNEVRRKEQSAPVDKLSKYRKSGQFDINGVEILEGSIINADGYKSDLERNYFHCVEYIECGLSGSFGSDIYADFDLLSTYGKIEVVGHCSDYEEKIKDENWEWSGNLGAVIKR